MESKVCSPFYLSDFTFSDRLAYLKLEFSHTRNFDCSGSVLRGYPALLRYSTVSTMFNKLLLGLTPLRLSDGPRQILFCYSPFELKLPHTTFEVQNAQQMLLTGVFL